MSSWLVPGLIFAVVAVFYAVPFVLGQRSMRAEGPRLLLEGELAEAEILGYERGEFHVVRYRFTPAGATSPVECHKIIGESEQQYPPGTHVQVRYKKRFPKISVLVPYARTQLPTS